MAAVVQGQRVVWKGEHWVVARLWNTNIEGWRVDLRLADNPAVSASVQVTELEEVL